MVKENHGHAISVNSVEGGALSFGNNNDAKQDEKVKDK
jgi:hypothetical protein